MPSAALGVPIPAGVWRQVEALAQRLDATAQDVVQAAVAGLLHRYTLDDEVPLGPVQLDLAGNPGLAELVARLRRSRAQGGPAPALPEKAEPAVLRLPPSAQERTPVPPELALAHCLRLLAAAVAEPDRPLAELPLLDGAERDQVVSGWNRTRRERPAATLHGLVEAQAARTPEALAVAFEGRSLTYAALDRLARRLAARLRRLGVGPDRVVGVCMERSLELPVALLGVLKAGGAYLPLDPEHPPARLRLLLEDAAAPVLLTQGALAGRPPAFAGVTEAVDIAGLETGDEVWPAAGQSKPEHLAYVIYTSGSTGRPKGVMVTHGAICNRLLWMQETYGLTVRDRVLHKTPFTFDVSVWEFFWPLLAGAGLVLARPGGHRDRAYLALAIAEHGITTVHFVPSMLADFLLHPDLAGCSSLVRVICSGEALAPDLQRRFFERLDAELHNLYGPTEAAVDVSAWRCRRQDAGALVPIGRPISNVRLHVLDASLRPVPPGVAGELFIGGAALARGYVGRPDLTAESFVPDPFGEWPGGRLYRSGDLARRRVDGSLEFLGRRDDQVKVRGVRIELGEVEAALRVHPAVADAAVAARGDRAGGRRLVAYMVPRRAAAPAPELRAFLLERLPEAMVPAAFVALAALPLTPSGKLDRRALPEPGRARPDLGHPPVPPSTPRELELAAMFQELLGLDEVGVTDDLFALGGHSLIAARLLARVRDRFGAELPLEAAFQRPTVEGLAELVAEAGAGGAPGPRPRPGRGGAAPLGLAQERVWFLQALHPDLRAYHFQATLRLEGHLDLAGLEAALNEVVRRHEVLRTTFPALDGRPVQVVHEFRPFALPIAEADATEESALLREELAQPFDLTRLPLVRWTLLRLAPQHHLLVHVEHHMIHDGWSFNVLLHELVELYRAFSRGRPSPLPEPPLQFADCARWERDWLGTAEAARQGEYWRRKLAGAPQVLRLPTDRPRPPVERFRGHVLRVELPEELCGALRALGRSQRATLFTTLLAGFAALLGRYSGQQELCVGSGFAARRWRQLEGVIGMFVNTVVLRLDLSGDPSFGELLQRVGQVTLEALGNQECPFGHLVEELQPHRDLACNPLFQAMFSFNDHVLPDLDLPGLRVRLTEGISNGSAKMDLNVIAIPRWEQRVGVRTGEAATGITLLWEYSSDLFDAATAERMVDHYRTLLAAAAAEPRRRLSELPLEPASAGPARPAPGYPTWCLHERFAEVAARQPLAVAVVCEGRSLTYGELDARAERLAGELRGLGIGPEDVVGICLERSADLVVAMLAVLKAGAAYLPLDPAHPPLRLAELLRDAGAALLLVEGPPAPELAAAAPVLALDGELRPGAAARPAGPPRRALPANAAYVIYTSGSTGVPKGVVVTHANVSRLLEAAQEEFQLGPADVWTLFHSFAFDFSVWEAWGALAFGGRLVIVPHWVTRSPEAFRELLLDQGVTVLSQTPSAFRQLIRADEAADGGGEWRLRLVVLGGEALDPALLEPWLRLHGDRRPLLVNMYGITETTVHVTRLCLDAAHMREASGSPIGDPLPDLSLHVLDGGLRPLPAGVAGELCVGGAGLARGYLGRPALTAERFVPDPFAAEPGGRLYRSGDLGRRLPGGGVEYLGRADQQVKVRGFRIELGEVEAALTRHPQVREAAAFTRPAADGQQELAACVVPAGQAPPARELREHLQGRLPDFMVPSAFAAVERLPVTPNGKLDRRALAGLAAEPLAAAAAFVPPRGQTEETVAEIWQALLGQPRIGAQDDFFELGGHSLVAMQVAARLRDRFGITLPVRAIFEAPTVAALAARVEAARRDG